METEIWKTYFLTPQESDPFSQWMDPEDFIPQERGDVSLYETDCDLVAKAKVPGVAAENIAIWIDGGLLTIAACQDESDDERLNKRVVYREATETEYIYNVPIVRPINAQEATALIENGIVTVTMPKD